LSINLVTMNVIAPPEGLSSDDLAVKGILLLAYRKNVILPGRQNIVGQAYKVLIIKSVALGVEVDGSSHIAVSKTLADREGAAAGSALAAAIGIFTVTTDEVFIDLGTVIVDIAIATSISETPPKPERKPRAIPAESSGTW
jgi:very-short-patch-repair endonuclease